ncbi:hypothetical protein [Nocardiopsis dassonvillei]|nr:hypothetical protein [Nocardiopsis dassonvillei]
MSGAATATLAPTALPRTPPLLRSAATDPTGTSAQTHLEHTP